MCCIKYLTKCEKFHLMQASMVGESVIGFCIHQWQLSCRRKVSGRGKKWGETKRGGGWQQWWDATPPKFIMGDLASGPGSEVRLGLRLLQWGAPWWAELTQIYVTITTFDIKHDKPSPQKAGMCRTFLYLFWDIFGLKCDPPHALQYPPGMQISPQSFLGCFFTNTLQSKKLTWAIRWRGRDQAWATAGGSIVRSRFALGFWLFLMITMSITSWWKMVSTA